MHIIIIIRRMSGDPLKSGIEHLIINPSADY